MPMTARLAPLAPISVLVAALLVAAPAVAANGPFGVGLPEPAASSSLLPGLFHVIAT